MEPLNSRPPARYAAAANGVLTADGLREACGRVWRDSNSIVMLGADPLNAEPVAYDDKEALTALRRHIVAAGPRSFIDDVLPNLRFGPSRTEPENGIVPFEQRPAAHEEANVDDGRTLTCASCGKEAVPLHLGCPMCEDCCDCRPYGT